MKTLSDKLARTQIRWKAEVPKLVRSMTNDAATYFKTLVFNREGFDVQPQGRWKKRKKETKKTIGKKILVSSGRMRRSITANSRGNVGVISTNVPYAQYHMEGTKNMPQRKFMGDSRILNGKFELKINRVLNRVFER
jgi:phage gpG-like protein